MPFGHACKPQIKTGHLHRGSEWRGPGLSPKDGVRLPMLSCSRVDECYAEAEMVRPGGPPPPHAGSPGGAHRRGGTRRKSRGRRGRGAPSHCAGCPGRAVQSDSLTPRPAPRAPRLPRHRRPPQGRLPRGAPGTLPPTRGARRGCSGCSAAGPHPHVETLEEGAPTGHMSQVGGWGCPLCTLGPQSVHWGMPALCVRVRICARECAHASVCSSAHMFMCAHRCTCKCTCVHAH